MALQSFAATDIDPMAVMPNNLNVVFRFEATSDAETLVDAEDDVDGRGPEIDETDHKGGLRRALLVGQPNVGKSVIFGALTGTYVTVSNYPGTTVGSLAGAPRLVAWRGRSSIPRARTTSFL